MPNAVLDLSIPEMIAYLCAPGRDLTRLEGEVLEKLATAAWYLHSNRDGKLFFQKVQNLNARLEWPVKNYVPEQAIKELRTRLEELFKPVTSGCYQHVPALPAIDEIELEQDRVTRVITEPHPGIGLRKELKELYEQATWKNRVGFPTGFKTFTRLWLPIDTGLVNADFRMKFEGNKYSGEQQVIEVLREKAKFTDTPATGISVRRPPPARPGWTAPS